MKTQLILNRAVLMAMLLLCCNTLLINSIAHAQFSGGPGQTSVGYLDEYGNGILTVSVGTLDTAFIDQFNSGSDTLAYNADFPGISILLLSDGNYHLVAQGSNSNFGSLVAKVILTPDGSGNLFINDAAMQSCSMLCASMGGCYPECESVICQCIIDDDEELEIPDHLGDFY